MGDNNLEEIISLQRMFANMSESERQQTREDLEELQGKTKKVTFKVRATAKSFRKAADKLDKVWRDCKMSNAVGNSSGIVGGILTVGGGIATMMTAGTAAPLMLLVGMGFGAAGVGAKLGTGFVESSINTTEIKKAEKDLKETLDCINDVQDTVQWWLNRKEEARLLFIYCLAMQTLQLSDPVLKLLQKVLSCVTSIPKVIVEAATRLFAEVGQPCAQAAGQAGIQAAGQAGAQVAEQLSVQVSRQVGVEVSRQGGVQVSRQTSVQISRQAGAQAAEQAAKEAAAQAAVKAGGLIIAFTIPFLIWDAIDLGFTIRDLVENKGSEAADFLREKADELEKY